MDRNDEEFALDNSALNLSSYIKITNLVTPVWARPESSFTLNLQPNFPGTSTRFLFLYKK